MGMKAATITHTNEISAALANGGAPVVVDVLGVVCDFCATAMNKIFSKRDEVAAIYVDLDKKTLSLVINDGSDLSCLLYTSPSPRDLSTSRMPSSA